MEPKRGALQPIASRSCYGGASRLPLKFCAVRSGQNAVVSWATVTAQEWGQPLPFMWIFNLPVRQVELLPSCP
jgi:hypothetical protein